MHARSRTRARTQDDKKVSDARIPRGNTSRNHPAVEDDDSEEEPPAKKQATVSIKEKAEKPAAAVPVAPVVPVAKNPPPPRQHAADEKEEKWDLNYRAVLEFVGKNNGKLPFSRCVYSFEGHELNLGNFINIMKMRHRGTNKRPPLNEEEKTKLGEIEAWTTWSTKNLPRQDAAEKEEKWDVMFNLVKDYESKEGKLPSSCSKESKGQRSVKELGKWVMTQKERYKNQGEKKGLLQLREEQKEQLRELKSWKTWEDKVSNRPPTASSSQSKNEAKSEAKSEANPLPIDPLPVVSKKASTKGTQPAAVAAVPAAAASSSSSSSSSASAAERLSTTVAASASSLLSLFKGKQG